MLLLIPLLPFFGFLVNAAFGRRLAKPISGSVACFAIIASFVVSLFRHRETLSPDAFTALKW